MCLFLCTANIKMNGSCADMSHVSCSHTVCCLPNLHSGNRDRISSETREKNQRVGAVTSHPLQTPPCIWLASLPCNDACVLLTLGPVFAAVRANVVELHLAFGCHCFQAGWWWWWDAGLLVCPREHLPKLLFRCVCVWGAEKSNAVLCYHFIDLCSACHLVTTKMRLI